MHDCASILDSVAIKADIPCFHDSSFCRFPYLTLTVIVTLGYFMDQKDHSRNTVSCPQSLRIQSWRALTCSYYAIGASVSSLHIESTDSLIVCFFLSRKWGKEMDEAIEKLRKEMVKELHAYVANTLKDWVINEVNLMRVPLWTAV